MDVTGTGSSRADATPSGEADLDLTPRTSGDPRPRRRGGGWVAVGVLALVVVAGFFVVRSLGSATVFFLNADEAVAQKADLADKRFRLQGTVVPGSVSRTADGVAFEVVYKGVEVPVTHVGDPPQLFQPDIPVVLEGRWNDAQTAFASDRIMVKHTEEYDAENPDRITEAENQGGYTPPAPAAPGAGTP